jgi:hypothetical protein
MSPKTAANFTDSDPDYATLETLVARRVSEASKAPVFTTDVDPGLLWKAYLDYLPGDRQHYTCKCCEAFVRSYGGLVHVLESGLHVSVLWSINDVPGFFRTPVREMWDLVSKANVNGVFYSAQPTLGSKEKGGWSHLSGSYPATPNANAKSAEKSQDFGMLKHGLSDYPIDLARQAVRILEADALDRSEKALGVAQWFFKLHESLEGVKDQRRRNNLIWLAVATAPPGFCHVRSTMIPTLLDDLKAGMDFDTVKTRWAKKMHPLQYRRPTAEVSDGQIKAAEKLVEELGIASAFRRRFATLDDVQVKLWTPTELPKRPDSGGVFGHLRKPTPATKVDLPEARVTWTKFQRDVLPKAYSMSVQVTGGLQYFYGLTTAVDPEAVPIIQWDFVDHRNPVSPYCYVNGSTGRQWGLKSGPAKVTAVFLAPSQWRDGFENHGKVAHFALEGAMDTGTPSICLFPEILKSELHPIRAVVEANNRTQHLEGTGNANGIAFTGERPVSVTVHTELGDEKYLIDRWE